MRPEAHAGRANRPGGATGAGAPRRHVHPSAQVCGNAYRSDLAALNIMTRRACLLGLDAPVRTENRTDLTTQSEGVLVVGGVMTPEDWAATAKAQQETMTRGD